MSNAMNWLDICSLNDLVPNSGVCALVEEEQVALFYIPENNTVYALGQYDPFGKANVMSRGLIGSKEDKLFVASPLYKQHFLLESGQCLEDESVSLPIWQTKLEGGRVFINAG